VEMTRIGGRCRAVSVGAVLIVAAAGGCPHAATAGGTWDQVLQFVPDPDPNGGHFGCSVALEGSEVLIGEWARDSTKGAAYLFDLGSGERIGMIYPEDRQPEGQFGRRVAMNDRTFVIAQRGDADRGVGAGAIYVFDRATRLQRFKLTPDDGGPNWRFGEGLALRDSQVLVGSPGDATLGASAGSAYLFDLETGQQLQKFVAPDGVPLDNFGRSVAFGAGTDEIAVVGALTQDLEQGLINTGAAYVFNLSDGTPLHKLIADDLQTNARLGESVAAAPGLVLAGAPGENSVEYREGAVFIFDLVSGDQLRILVPTDASPGMEFGYSMAVDGGRVIVGAHFESSVRFQQGAAYLFDIASGAELAKFQPRNSSNVESWFGESVALRGNHAVVGAVYDFANGRPNGSAYLYGNDTPTLTLEPAPLVATQPVRFVLTNLTPDAATWMLVSTRGLDPRGVFIRRLNVVIDLADPAVVWGPVASGPDGSLSVDGVVPNVPGPTPVWFQAVQDTVVTNAAETEIVRP